MEIPDVTIVVPCYNEAGRLRLDEFRAFTDAEPRVRFLFVDDGSTDETAVVIAAAAESNSAFALLSLPNNRGKAEAVRAGIVAAIEDGSRYVGYWDADLSTPLAAIESFCSVLDGDPAIAAVLGSRVRLLGRKVDRKPSRHYSGRFFAAAASLILGLPVYDTQCGAKLFRVTTESYDLFQQPFLSRWIFDVEILARLVTRRQVGDRGAAITPPIVEFPLEKWTDIPGSRLRPSDYLRAAVEIIRIWRRYAVGFRSIQGTARKRSQERQGP